MIKVSLLQVILMLKHTAPGRIFFLFRERCAGWFHLTPAHAAVLLLSVSVSCSPDVNIDPAFLPADGTSAGTVSAGTRNPFSRVTITGPSGNTGSIRVVENKETGNFHVVKFHSTLLPGRVFFTINNRPYYVTVYNPRLDSDDDGFPDMVELDNENDRMAFRNWFVRIALAQYLKRNTAWQDSQRDCSGLIRYACREALKVHDGKWFARSGIPVDKNLPDVVKYNYPSVPLVGEKLFRVHDKPDMSMKAFSGFCDAGTLVAFNLHRIGTNLDDALEGDILFFMIMRDGREQYHSMIVVETRPEVRVVYHTGIGDVMKCVPAGYLDDAGPFRPVGWNRRFLGIYRFNILE